MTRHIPRVTPRSTPVAQGPKSSILPSASEAKPPRLEPPILVVAPDGGRELEQGTLSVGRLFSADILLDDPLVSRVHARISVELDSVFVEDLQSTNGVFVNGTRIGPGKNALSEGDRILIGTTELSVFSASRRALPAERLALPFSDLPRRSEQVPSTVPAASIELVGKLALRHAANGDVGEAVRVLSNHLNKLLLSTTAGLGVPEAQLDRATEFALQLYSWTDNTAWIDYVIDLHLSVQALPSELVLGLLESTLGNHDVKFDRLLLVYLVEKLEKKKTTFSSAERARLARLDRITRFL